MVDISHEVEPFHLQQAAYLLSASYKQFPDNTCHLVLCDIFSQKQPQLLLCEKDKQYFLAPANGILSLVFGKEYTSAWKYFELSSTGSFKDWLHEAGILINKLQEQMPTDLALEPYEIPVTPLSWLPKIDGSSVECHVIHIDRFGNVVINITREQFEKIGRNRPFIIEFVRESITELSNSYADVREGEKLCRFNSTGYLEICINRGNASSLLGLRLRREQHLIYNIIKISFQ